MRVALFAVEGFALILACGGADRAPQKREKQGDSDRGVGQVPAEQIGLDTVASGLEVPWAMAFAPDGRLFVTERPGRIRVVEHGKLLPSPWATLDVDSGGEDGLMGLALAPDFETSHELFVVGTFRDGGDLVNRLVRFTERNAAGVEPTVILDKIPSNSLHAGDAIAFGPDGMLYVATGDARTPPNAQRDASLAGKILRITRDGRVPADNPNRASPVYARGFRNVQGLAWDPSGQLFATEHGPSGFANELMRHDNDELNAVVRDGNYGWPIVAGSGGPSAYRQPIAVWNPGIAPSGLAVYDGSEFPEWRGNLFVGALRGQHLRRIAVAKTGATWHVVDQHPLFDQQLGRVRAVVFAPDGHLYFSVTNRDGRAPVRAGDDKIFRVVRRR